MKIKHDYEDDYYCYIGTMSLNYVSTFFKDKIYIYVRDTLNLPPSLTHTQSPMYVHINAYELLKLVHKYIKIDLEHFV